MKKDQRVYLAEDRALHGGRRAQFHSDTMLQDAVIRNFEIIGEAAKRVPESYRKKHPRVPWRLMAGFRDVLIHAYEGVDLKHVWKIVKQDLPLVKTSMEKILPSLEELEKELAGAKTNKKTPDQ